MRECLSVCVCVTCMTLQNFLEPVYILILLLFIHSFKFCCYCVCEWECFLHSLPPTFFACVYNILECCCCCCYLEESGSWLYLYIFLPCFENRFHVWPLCATGCLSVCLYVCVLLLLSEWVLLWRLMWCWWWLWTWYTKLWGGRPEINTSFRDLGTRTFRRAQQISGLIKVHCAH